MLIEQFFSTIKYNLFVFGRMVGGIAQEINARSEVLRIERELEEARHRLAAIRRAKYQGGADSDVDGYQSGYDSSMETSGYRTTMNGSESMERTTHSTSIIQESSPRVRQVIQQQQQQQQQHRSDSPVTKKQPPATPPRHSSTMIPLQQDSALLLLQRQRKLLETVGTNSTIEEHTPSFSESLHKFKSSGMTISTMSTFQSSTTTSSTQHYQTKDN